MRRYEEVMCKRGENTRCTQEKQRQMMQYNIFDMNIHTDTATDTDTMHCMGTDNAIGTHIDVGQRTGAGIDVYMRCGMNTYSRIHTDTYMSTIIDTMR